MSLASAQRTVGREWRGVICGGRAAVLRAVVVAWILGVALGASAQLAVSVQLQDAKTVLCEPVFARVNVKNMTGQTLRVGDVSKGVGLSFDIERRDRNLVRRRAGAAGSGVWVDIMPGESKVLEVSLSREYELNRLDSFRVQAVLAYDRMVFRSEKVPLEIVKGFELKRLQAEVPGSGGVMQLYVLDYLQRESSETVYLRIEDPDSQTIYGVFNLGHILRVRPPLMETDESGNIHVLFQSVGMSFVHAAFTPMGLPLISESYAGGPGRKGLSRLPNGRIAVVDGLGAPIRSRESEMGQPAVPVAPAGTVLPQKKKGEGGLLGRYF